MLSKKLIMVLSCTITATAGFVAGILVRQPEINKLRKQIEDLQQNNEKLKNALSEQNDKLAQLFISYKSINIFRILKRRKVKEDVRLHLVFQYATSDYLNLMIDRVENKYKMSREEIEFYRNYEKIIADGVIEDPELELIKEYILSNHFNDIQKLKECDTNLAFERIKNFNR